MFYVCACPSQNFVITQNENVKTAFGHHCLTATVEKFYDIVERVHSTENGHVDYKKILGSIIDYVCYHIPEHHSTSHKTLNVVEMGG